MTTYCSACDKNVLDGENPKCPHTSKSDLMHLLGPDHEGMRISAQGLLGRVRDGWDVSDGTRYAVGELLRHLQMMADGFYAGDPTIVDEMLQLYSLDAKRP